MAEAIGAREPQLRGLGRAAQDFDERGLIHALGIAHAGCIREKFGEALERFGLGVLQERIKRQRRVAIDIAARLPS